MAPRFKKVAPGDYETHDGRFRMWRLPGVNPPAWNVEDVWFDAITDSEAGSAYDGLLVGGAATMLDAIGLFDVAYTELVVDARTTSSSTTTGEEIPMAASTSKSMTTREAIFAVLKTGGTMKVPDIITAVLKKATGLKGKTPGQTVYSILYAENKKADGLFQQVAKGTFKLRDGATLAKATTKASNPASVKAESTVRNGDAADEISPIEGAVVVSTGRQAKPDPKPTPKARSSRSGGRAKKEGVAS